MDQLSHQITIRHSRLTATSDLYELESAAGKIDAVYHTDEMRYTIANFDVDSDKRRQGIGKHLLKASQEHARELGAKVIFSAIISRECLDAMTRVFGEESVLVAEVGEYASNDGSESPATTTAAILHYNTNATK